MNASTARALAACLMFVGLVTNAWAEDAPVSLSLQDAMAKALERNPDLRTFAYRFKVQQARGGTATLRPAPELRADIEDALGTGAASGFGATQFTLALSQVIELGGKRDARIGSASAGLDLLGTEQQSRQLDVLAEVARRYIHLAADQERLSLSRLAVELAQQTVAAAQQRLDAAKAPEVELRRARISLARAELEEEHTEHELQTSRRKLAAMWGDTEPKFELVSADLFALPVLGEFSPMVDRLGQNPDALRFVSESRLRDADVRLTETRARSDVTLTTGVRRLQETEDHAFIFGFSMPLFSSGRAKSAIAEVEAQRGQTEAEREAHRIRVHTQLYELFQELRHAITEADTLRIRVLPEMEAALKDSRYAFERGRYGYLEWAEAQRELLDVRRALIEAASNAHLYRAEIERLTGDAVSQPQH